MSTTTSNDPNIIDGSEQTFMNDVIEASMTTPVIVDFWATWCGPCRQLTPTLEKVIKESKGKVKLVKIDVDQNQAIAAQLRIQSIPTVYAFSGGRPVDGFMGAKSETEVRAFVEKLGISESGPTIEETLALAAQSAADGDITSAMEAYSFILEQDIENPKANAGMARLYLKAGQAEQARAFLNNVPAGSKDAEVLGLRAALELAEGAPADISGLRARLAANPRDFDAMYELGQALASQGETAEAINQLLDIVKYEPDWNDKAAQNYLFKIFTAIGPSSDLARAGRRRLSSMLFS